MPKKTAKNTTQKLPSAYRITKVAMRGLWQNKKQFLVLTLVYALLSLLFVKGFSAGVNAGEIKAQFNELFGGGIGSVASGLGVFMVLLGSSGSTATATGSAYQLFLGLIVSLAVIWMLRQFASGTKKLRVRDAFYQGMYPLVPFIAVLVIICLQLLPMLIGSALYSMVVANGIAIGVIEKILWFVVFIALSALSLYWVSGSIMGLYISTLPNMAPIRSLKSAKKLVAGRRGRVVLKILWLPLFLLVAAAVIMLPIIMLSSALAAFVFFLLSMFSLVVAHAYFYQLYRELLGE